MGNIKPFQLIFIVGCVVLTVIGVFAFSFLGPKPGDKAFIGPRVVMWGTEDENDFNDMILQSNEAGHPLNVTYVQKSDATFYQDLLEALATRKGPDVILVPAENLLTYQDKLITIPFESLTERDFKDSFIEQGELFRTSRGYLAVPFSIDPLVLYWNRDIFTIHDKTAPPSNWNTVVSLVPEMRDISEDLTVFESVISLGDYRNVNNAKAIMAALMLQSGTTITRLSYNQNADTLSLSSRLNESTRDSLVNPSVAALNFYTQFADPLTKVYSWNRSLPNSLDLFASDDLAMYIGFGSEKDTIRSKNPNLNFDMALLPQSDSNPVPMTYGKMKGLAILATSANQAGSFQAVLGLTSSDFLKRVANLTGLPPVRRDLLATPPATAEGSILYRSALYSRGFLDPNPVRTDAIFQTMVESVLAGRQPSMSAVQTANSQLDLVADEFNRKQETI